MANSSFELSQPSIEQLNKSLDKLVTSMNSLEKRLASLQKNNKSAFERVFGSQKDFDAIIRSINKLNTTGVQGLKSLTSSIKSLANSLTELPAKAPTQFFNSLIKIIDTVNSAKFKNNDNLKSFLAVLSGAVKSLSSLETIPESAARSIRTISTAIIAAAKLATDKSVGAINQAQLNQVGNIGRLVTLYKQIVNSLADLDRLGPNAIVSLKNLGSFGRAVSDLGRGFRLLTENVKNIDIKTILKLGLIVGAVSAQLRAITGLTQSTSSLKDVAVLSRVFDQIGFGLLAITRSVDQINLKQIAKIGLVVLGISVAFQGVAKLLSALPGFEQLSRLSSIFSALSNSINFFTKFAETINIVKTISITLKLRTFFSALGGALAGAANAVAKKHGLENLTSLAEIFSRIGPAITSILKIAEKLPLFNPIKIIKQFLQIRALVNTVTQIAGGLAKSANKLAGSNGLQNLDQLSVIFDRLGRGIRSLLGAAGVVEKAKLINLNPVKQLFKSIEPLFKQLRKFKNATLPDFGAIFASLFKFAADSTDAKFDRTALKEFQGFTKDLAKGLNELARVRIDSKKLDAISNLLTSVSAIKGDLKGFTGGGVSGGVGVPLGRELSDEVEEGFLSGQIRLKIFEIMVRAFKALNPFTLTKDFVTGLIRVFTNLANLPDQFVKKLKDAGTALQNLGSSLKTSGLALINGIGLGGIANNSFFQAAVGFDNLSTQVKNFGNLTDEQLKSAQAFSNEIGIKYPQSSNEALQATLNLLKAGLDLNDTFTALPAAADLSAISDTHNLDEASKAIILVTQSFKDFNDTTVGSFENASVASDIIARAANNSTASVESLTEGLKNVASVANAAGLSLEETTAILGLFSDAGIVGAEGGTQLKSLLTNITRATPQVTGELNRLGVSLKDAEGNIRPINDIINDLSTALFETKTVTVSFGKATADQQPRLNAAEKAYASATRQILLYQDGLTTGALDQEKANKKIGELSAVQANAQRVIQEITGSQADTESITAQITRGQFENFQSIQKLAGSFGQAGLNILLSQGQDAIKGFVEEMGRLPTAAEQAQLLLDNLSGDVQQLQGSVETLGTRAFLPLISRVFRPLVKIGRLVVDFFNSLPDPILETIVNAGVLVSILATLAGGFLVAAGFLAQFSGIILTVVGSITGLLVNIPLVVAALGGFVASFAALLAIGTVIAPILLGISSVITTFFRVIENNVGGAGNALGALQETIGKLASSIGEVFSLGGDIISTIFGSGLNEQNIQLGERVAAFFTDINDQVLLLKEKIQVVKDFFGGFKAFLNIGNEDETRAKLIAKFTEEMPGAPEIVILGRVNEELSKSKKTLNTLATSLAGSSIFQSFIGREVSPTSIIRIFDSIQTGLEQTRRSFVGSLGAGKSLLLDALGVSKLNPKQLSRAKSDLLRNLSDLGTVGLTAISKLTGLDFHESFSLAFQSAFESFRQGDFITGARTLLLSFIGAIRDNILSLRGEEKITNILTSIFNFLIPGKFVLPILRFFGLDTAADSIQGVFDEITKLFRGAIGFIFDLLRGKDLNEALFGNFGTAAKPISRLINAIGKAFTSLIGIFEGLFKVLFPSGLGTKEGGFLEAVIDGIASAFEFFTSAVLEPIRIVLPQLIQVLGNLGRAAITVIGGLFDLLGKVAQPLTKLFTELFSGKIDIGGFLAQIGPAFVTTLTNLVQSLPGLVGSLLSGLGMLIGSPLLTQIGTDLQNGDFSSAIATVASALTSLIKSAISSIPTLLTDLGTSLGSPLLTKIGEALGQGDLLAALGAVTESIANLIKNALGDVPAKLIELGTNLDLSFLKDLGLTLEQSDLFKGFVEGIGNLLAFPAEMITAVVDGIKGIVDAISAMASDETGAGQQRLLGIGIAIGVVALALTGSTIATALSSILSGILAFGGTTLLPIIGTFLLIATAILTIKNALQNLGDLLSGKQNLGEFIGNTLSGIASDILSFLGVNISAEEISARITGLFQQVVTIAGVFISNAVNAIKTGVQNIIDGILGSLDDASARVDQSIVGQHSGFGDLFFQLQQGVSDRNFRAISQTLGDAAAKGLDLEPFRRALRNNFTGVIEAFKQDIPKLGDFSDADFGAVINSLVNANALDDAITQLPPEMIPDFYKRLFSVDPAMLAGLDFTTIQTTLGSALASGIFDLSQVSDFVLKLPNLTEEQKKAIIDGFKAQLTPTTPVSVDVDVSVQPKMGPLLPSDTDPVKKTIEEIFPGLDIKIPVTPVVEAKPLTPEETQAIVDQTTQSLLPTGTEPPKVEVPVDVTAIADPETAQLFADNLATVTTNAGLAQTALTELQAQTALISGDLTLASASVGQYAIDVDANTLLAEVQWVEHGALVTPILLRIAAALGGITQRFQEISIKVDEAGATYPKKLGLVSTAFIVFANSAIGPLDRLNGKLRDINFILQQIIGNLGIVTGTEVNTGGGPDGRALGGDVFAGKLYEVAERGISELLRIGNKTFLIPGQNGTVIPPTSVSGFAPPPPAANRNVSNNSSIINVDAPIQIELSLPPGLNVEQVANEVAKRVQPLGNNIAVDVRRKLLLAGSSGA